MLRYKDFILDIPLSRSKEPRSRVVLLCELRLVIIVIGPIRITEVQATAIQAIRVTEMSASAVPTTCVGVVRAALKEKV